jgi:prolyl-tRNA synthetase
MGAKNVQLPLFIKNSDFLLEKNHIAGFSAEAFKVNGVGENTFSDPLIVRPTSEVLFSNVFHQEIKNYKDLPMIYNQWCSVYRDEKNTRPFLRGCEFF